MRCVAFSCSTSSLDTCTRSCYNKEDRLRQHNTVSVQGWDLASQGVVVQPGIRGCADLALTRSCYRLSSPYFFEFTDRVRQHVENSTRPLEIAQLTKYTR